MFFIYENTKVYPHFYFRILVIFITLKYFFLFREELIALMKEMKEQIPLKKAEISGTYKHRFHNDYNLEIHLCLFL